LIVGELPILLLHGALGSRDQLKPLANVLKPDHSVFRINFYGHGKAAPATHPFRLDAFADQVADWMDRQERKRINIFGYSMGGYVALQLARKHPEKVNRIVTLGTKLNWNPEGASKEINMLNPKLIEEKVPAFAAMLKDRHGADHWREMLKRTAEMMLDLGDGAAWSESDFKEVNVPVKLMLGTSDQMVTQAETERTAQWISGATMQLLPDVPHPIEKIDPEMLGDRVSEFFR